MQKLYLPKVLLIALLMTGSFLAVSAQDKPPGEPAAASDPQAPAQPEKSLIKSKKKRYVLFPVVVKSPEYLWGAGGAGTYYFKFGHDTTVRSSNIRAVAFYTLRKQTVIGTETTIYSPSEKYIFHMMASFSEFPDRFWGIGDYTPSSNQEKYSITQMSFTPQISRKFFSSMYVGVGYDMQDVFTFTYNKDGTSLFDKENVPGKNGGRISGPSFLLTFDNRNNAFSPDKGFYAQYLLSHHFTAFGSNFVFTVQQLDVRKYFNLKKNRVLAFQLVLINNIGTVPIRSLANMGNSSFQRGYYDGRYADKNLSSIQVEYRTPVYKRIGAVLFSGVGRVGPTFADVFILNNLKPSIGFGLRYSLNPKEKLNLRFDAGWGKQSSGTYINLGEAF